MIAALALALVLAQGPDTVTDIRVQGNVLTTDDAMRALAGVDIGAPFTDDLPARVAERLKATHKFETVEVLKRYGSIEDASKIVLVIIVNEGPVKVDLFSGVDEPGAARAVRVVRRGGFGVLWLPKLDFEDGYGWSYGAQFAKTKVLGENSRLSFPLTWGGTRQAGAELEKNFHAGPVTRLEAGAGIVERTNPFFEQDDTRDRVWLRAERTITPVLRVGASTGWQRVDFRNTSDRFTQAGADVTLDTRLDPFLARNAVYARASIEHLDFRSAPLTASQHAAAANRTELEGRGYVGLIGQNILVVRALRQDSDVPLPEYLQPMLGGTANLRGFSAGSAIGDTLVAGAAELRAPLTSPLSIGKFGVSAFMDIGTIYNKGQRLSDQHFERGVGGGIWFAAAFIRLNLVLAHGIGGTTRVHFGTSVTF